MSIGGGASARFLWYYLLFSVHFACRSVIGIQKAVCDPFLLIGDQSVEADVPGMRGEVLFVDDAG